jgi:peptide/nickel transport system substrate-binding protein
MSPEKGYWRNGVRRREVLRGAAVAAAALSASSVIGCGGQEGPTITTGSPPATQAKRGGTISYAGGTRSFDTAAVGFDPHTYLAIAAEGYRLFYQGLLAYNLRTYEIEPELAQRWEQPSQTEYIFTLQPNVKWHNKPPANGRALTVEDIVSSLERARSDEPRFFSRAVLLNVDKIEAVDRTRVRITTKGPDATTLGKMSGDLLMVLAPEVVEKAGKFAGADTVVGTGAFMMKSVEDGVGAEYVRNPDYWKAGLPYLDGFRTKHFKDELTAYAAFKGKQVDIAALLGQDVKGYLAEQAQGFTPDWFADNTYILGTPNTKMKPFDDARVTRALRLLIDYNEMIKTWTEVWFGRGRHVSVLPPALSAWDYTHEEYGQRIFWRQQKDEAVREGITLLSAAGFNRQNPLKFEFISQVTTFQQAWSELAQAQWRQLSQGAVDPELKLNDVPTVNQLRGQRRFSYLVHGFIPSVNEPDAWLTEFYRTGAATNFMGFSDPQADALIDRQRTLFDAQQRRAAVKEIVGYMMEHTPNVVPSGRYMLTAINPRIRGYTPEFFMFGRQYESVWLDA